MGHLPKQYIMDNYATERIALALEEMPKYIIFEQFQLSLY